MQRDIAAATRQAREDTSLRQMTSDIRQHFDYVRHSMYTRQALWGGNLTVIDTETEKMSAVIRRSLAFEKVMKEMPISIEPYALLAGRCAKDGQIVRCILPAYILESELGQCSMHISHKCPDYETLLKIGLSGVLANLEKSKANCDAKGVYDATKRDFYEAVRRECQAVIHLAHRYAKLADESGMPKLAQTCRRVPEHGADSFREAVQSIWLYNHCIHETMTKLPIGNIDRLLNPYFEKDYKAGKITPIEAQELVDAFNLRVNDRVQIDPTQYVVPHNKLEGAPEKHFRIDSGQGFAASSENDGADAINHWGQNILLSGLYASGVNADGSQAGGVNAIDATNALTYMFLNAHEKFELASPVLTVRLHKKSPPELLNRVAEVLKTGGGMPFINNDDIIVSAYEKLGIPRVDACAYANSNCWETMIQGMSNQEMIRFVNFLYLLELALNQGNPVVYGQNIQLAQVKEAAQTKESTQAKEPAQKIYGFGCGPGNPVVNGAKTASVETFTSMDDIMCAWKAQMDYMLATSMEYVACEIETNGSHGKYSSVPILSAATRDCIENMTDLTKNGARYTLWHMMGEAVSNAADAMSAIQKFVYEEKVVTLERLVEILCQNWEGEEMLHQRFLTDTPRFGNGFMGPDGYAKQMVDYFVERVAYHAQKYTICTFSPCIGTFSWVISIGKNIGASADGRKSREPIAANMSPIPGADTSGPLAAIESYLKLKTHSMAAGAPIDLRVNSRGLEGADGTNRIAAIIKTFIQQGGNMLTLTITSADELKKAMAEPEKYRSLRVRMGGWSAYFTLLSKDAQALQLRRAENGS